MIKPFLATLAVVMAVSGYIPYLKDTFSGKTKPHIFSWFLWCLVSLIAFGLQITNKAGWGSLPNLVMGVICLVIFLKSMGNGKKGIKRTDVVSLFMAIISLVLWLIVKQPLISIVLIVVVDLFSFLPTITKSWNKPFEETLFTWTMNWVRQLIIIMSLEEINLINAMYPVYALTVNMLFWIMLLARRKQLSKISPEFGQA